MSREAPALDAAGQNVWFLGDFDDPWVAAIADALPGDVRFVPCAGEWPERLLSEPGMPECLVIHRGILTPRDAEWLARLRGERSPALRVIACVGPHARYHDIERWSSLVDLFVPEATARETLGRHLARGEASAAASGRESRAPIAVVSGNHELKLVLAELCEAAGYSSEQASDWSAIAPGALVVWDVPVLEPDWPATLARHSRRTTVVALLGFADRSLVAEARANGAAACLELPCDRSDLAWVLQRVSSTRAEGAHPVPPAPAVLRRPPRPVAGREPDAYNER